MQNQLTTFEHKIFGSIRALLDEDGEPLFLAYDIAQALGFRDIMKMLRFIHPKDQWFKKVDTADGTKSVRVINWHGLFAANFDHNLQRWIVKEVLPSLREPHAQ